MRTPCPTETSEEIDFSNYCKARGLVHWHVPQETYTTSWAQKSKNKAMGVLEGVSDHWVRVPLKTGGYGLVVIELKRLWGNTPSDAQIKFIHQMDEINNVAPVCCYGAEEAIAVIEEIEKGDFTTYDKCWQRMTKIEENRRKRAKNKEKMAKNKNVLPY